MRNEPHADMIVADPAIAPLQPLGVSPRTGADLLGISERLMGSLIASGKIPSVKIAGRRIIPVAELREWLSEQAKQEK